MDFSRAQDRLLSFAVSAMMTSAVLATAPQPGVMTAAAGPQPAQIMKMIDGARSAGFAGMKDIPAPATVAAPAATKPTTVVVKAAPTLTPAQLQKIRNYALGPNGMTDGIRGAIVSALGVGPANGSFQSRAMNAHDDPTKLTWEIWVLPDNGGYIIARLDDNINQTRFFRMDADMHLVKGVTVGDEHSTPVPIPAADAPALFASDLAEWAPIAGLIPD